MLKVSSFRNKSNDWSNTLFHSHIARHLPLSTFGKSRDEWTAALRPWIVRQS